MDAAQAFDGHDRPLANGFCRLGDRLLILHNRPLLVGALKPNARPAFRAGRGLGMEAAIARIVVITLAVRTELKPHHAGAYPIVGQGANHRQPRPAMGAVHEGIVIITAVGIVQIPQTGGTGGRVRRNLGAHRARLALQNPKRQGRSPQEFRRGQIQGAAAMGNRQGSRSRHDRGWGLQRRIQSWPQIRIIHHHRHDRPQGSRGRLYRFQGPQPIDGRLQEFCQLLRQGVGKFWIQGLM